MPGRGSSSGFFAFTARSVQTTKETPPYERRETIYYPQLSENGPRRCPEALLSDRISRNANRSRLRRSTIVRGLSHYLLHRLGAGIVLVVEIDGQIRGYLLGSRKPIKNQLYSFWQNVSLFVKALARYFLYNTSSRRFVRWVLVHGPREVPAAPRRVPHFHINLLPDPRKISITS